MSSASYNNIKIDLAALRYNYDQIGKLVGDRVRIMAIVKSDAYGHGLLPVAEVLSDAGASTFGVAETEEGVCLRQAGCEGEIVVLLGAPAESFAEVIQYCLTPVVYDLANLAALSISAEKKGARVGVHLKVDVGMGRLGIMPSELKLFVDEIGRLPGVYLAGILSHFPLADSNQSSPTLEQGRRFAGLAASIGTASDGEMVCHIANSAALIRYPETYFDMVRPGITLYGCYPGAESVLRGKLSLRPVMSFHSRVLQVKEVPADFGISYGHTYVTGRLTSLAVLPVGYDDGYLRSVTGKAEVLINGHRARVLGRVCMNACLADVTDIPGVQPGAEVVVMGRQGDDEINADEIAGWMNTISYEVLCLLGGSNKRLYIYD